MPSTIRRRALNGWAHANEARAKEGLVPLAPITLHECRHTFASVMIAAGVNAKDICEYMGHASITMTFDQYGKLMPGGRSESRSRADAYLAARSERPALAVVG